MNRIVRRFSLTWTFGLMLVFASAALAQQPPNVVLVITDDQGYGDLGCHGNTMIQTPHLDRLYAEAVRFTDFHVDPTCAETRAALMTGRYASRAGVWHTVMGRSILHPEEKTLAEAFAASGYRTGIFGKWHLGDNYPYRPQDRGFHESLIHGGGGVGQTPDYWGNDYFDDVYLRNGQPRQQTGYCTDVFFDAAMEFIEANRQSPFFCYLATNAPHSPYNVASEYSRPYEEKGVPQPMANFYGMITNLDENFGRLRRHLKELGLEKNTLVIFMTDNGSAAGTERAAKKRDAEKRDAEKRDAEKRDAEKRGSEATWNGYSAGMRGAKGSEYDGGHRVPCFIYWPGQIDGGRDVPQLAAHFDLFPTLIDLCQLNAPPEVDFDGRSLRPLLMGEGDWPERTLFVHSQRVDHPEKWRKCAVLTEQWRLVNGQELYGIQADPGQTNDVAAEHPEVAARLRAEYEAWWRHIDDRFDDSSRIPLAAGPQPADETVTRLTAHDWHAPISQIPWSQQQTVERGLAGNGYWEVEVPVAGEYEFALARWPREAKETTPLEAVKARITIGEVDYQHSLPAGSLEAVFRVPLQPGPARLQTWLIDRGGESRGAYYVYVKRIKTPAAQPEEKKAENEKDKKTERKQ